MSWPSIGGYSVITIQNWQQSFQGQSVEILKYRGVDGIAFLRTDYWADPTSLVSVGDVDSVSTMLVNFNALRGTKVTIVDDLEISTTNVMVLNMRKLSSRKITTPVGGVTDGQYLLVCQWDVVQTEL